MTCPQNDASRGVSMDSMWVARYVERGCGLFMVGGPDSFAGGHYAGTRLADVLPVALESSSSAFDLGPFKPSYTDVARSAPVLRSRADSSDWAGTVLAGLGCGFAIRRPDELRPSVRALGERLASSA
jgi:hypothetical protein